MFFQVPAVFRRGLPVFSTIAKTVCPKIRSVGVILTTKDLMLVDRG